MSLGLGEGLKIGVLEELAQVESKLPPFSLLMCLDLIKIPDLICTNSFLVLDQNIGVQYVFLNGIAVLRCKEGEIFNFKKISNFASQI